MFIVDMNKVKKYVGNVEKKLNSEKVTRYLQFGTKAKVAGQPVLRDSIGLAHTKATILQSAENLYKLTEGRDEFARAYKNFSANDTTHGEANTGYGQVGNVRTVGAIDITILAMSQSIIPFLAIDRSMATPEVTIYYNDLVALNDNGEISKGDIVSGNFKVPNPYVNLGPELVDAMETVEVTDEEGKPTGATTTRLKVKGLGALIKGSVTVTLEGGHVGRDFASDGTIYFPAGAGVEAATVDYVAGDITVTGGTITGVKAKRDQHADNKGDTTLKVANQWTAIQLKSDPQNIILNDNLMNRMYMQNTQMIATAGAGGTSAADVLFARTKNTYVEYLNAKLLKTMMEGMDHNHDTTIAAGKPHKSNDDDIFLDLSEYSVNNWAVTKNDLVSQVINNLRAKFLGTTNMGGTALITGSYGASLLSNIPNLWVPNPDQLSGMNGLVGYFSGLPVYRHSYIDSVQQAGRIEFYLVAKTPDNNSGSLVYGEFLPLTSTGVVSNFAQPSNISNGFFAQVGTKRITDSLVMRATIATPATGLFGEIAAY